MRILRRMATRNRKRGGLIMRHELIDAIINHYMAALDDNPEVIKAALYAYFDSFNNDVLTKTLNGFEAA